VKTLAARRSTLVSPGLLAVGALGGALGAFFILDLLPREASATVPAETFVARSAMLTDLRLPEERGTLSVLSGSPPASESTPAPVFSARRRAASPAAPLQPPAPAGVGLRPAQIRKSVAAHGPALRRCYERALRRRGEAFSQTGSLSLRVSPSGAVRRARLTGSFDPFFGSCVETAAAAWRFPSAGDWTVVELPIRLTPQSR